MAIQQIKIQATDFNNGDNGFEVDDIKLVTNPFYLATANVDYNFTVPEGYNAMTPGPVTIGDSATVTVSNNSVWTVV